MRLMESEVEIATAPAKGVVVRRAMQRRILTFLMVFGPGLIVMEADNDAGAVSTYMQAGGQYGLHLLWLLVVLLPICYFIQEMVARLGIATGKGHAAMIYERFGKWWGRFSLLDLLAVNFLTLIPSSLRSRLLLARSVSVPYLGAGLSRWLDVDGCHRELPSVGADRHCIVPDGSDLVRARLHDASALGDSCTTPWCRRCHPDKAAEGHEGVVHAVHRAAACVGRHRGEERGVGDAEADLLAFHVAAGLQRRYMLIDAHGLRVQERVGLRLGLVGGEDSGEAEGGHRGVDGPAVGGGARHAA
jgi:hypothetical protein